MKPAYFKQESINVIIRINECAQSTVYLQMYPGSGFNLSHEWMRAETEVVNIEINVLLAIHCPQDRSSLSSPVKPLW